MRQVVLFASFAAMVVALIACGKLNESFSRLPKDYTLVKFSHERRSYEAMGSQNGGVMIYIMNQAAGGGGKIVGYSNEDLANNAVVALPHGTYKFYALGFAGSYTAGGQVRCGFGGGGQPIDLYGASEIITIDLNKPNCSFGNDSPFSYAANSNSPSNTNFDEWMIQLCSGNPYPSCTAATSSTHGVKVTLLAGTGGGGNNISESPVHELVSACIAESSGVFSFAGDKFNAPFPSNFVMPVRLEIYADTACSTSVDRSLTFPDGLRAHTSASSASTVYVHSAASSSQTYIDLYKDF